MKIFRDRCVATCPSGMDTNADRRCLCRIGFATVNNDTCVRITDMASYQLGLYYNSTFNTFLNCPFGCLNCDNNICYKCQPGYILVASSSSSVCRK